MEAIYVDKKDNKYEFLNTIEISRISPAGSRKMVKSKRKNIELAL